MKQRIADLGTVFTPGTTLPALYAACAALGLGSGRPAPPWRPPDAAEHRRITAIVRRQGLRDASVSRSV